MAINNPFASQYGLGARISDTGFLSHFRWYDPLLLAANPMGGAAAIGGREAFEYLSTDPQQQPLDTPKPPKLPDFTDEALMVAARAQRQQLGQNRRSTFVSGQGASSTAVSAALLGVK